MSSVASAAPLVYSHPTAASDPSRVVVSVICVLGPRACVFAGLDRAGELMTFEQHLLPPEAGNWEETFLQNHFDSNKLFATKAQSCVLVCDPRQIVIPDPLYKEAKLSDWMRTCYFVAPDEDLVVTTVSGAPYRAATVCGAPLVKRVAERKVGRGAYALGAALLHDMPQKEGACARVMLTADGVCMAIWSDGNLLESLVFEETDAQSVAYRLHSLIHKAGLNNADVTLYVETLTYAPETVSLLGDYWLIANAENAISSEEAAWHHVARSFSRVRSCVL